MPLRRPVALASSLVCSGTICSVLAAGLLAPGATALPSATAATGGSVFVWYDSDATVAQRAVARASVGSSVSGPASAVTEVVPVPSGRTAHETAASLRTQPGVRFAVPDLAVRRDAAPDYLGADPRLW